MWTPLDLSFDHLTGLLNQVRRASPLSNCQRLDYPAALDLAKFLREQFPRVVRGAVTLVNNMAQTGPSRDAEEEFTRRLRTKWCQIIVTDGNRSMLSM